MDVNKAKYKQLRSKAYGRKKYANNFKQVLNNVMAELTPRKAPAQENQKQASETPDYSKEINKLSSKLQAKEKENSENTKLYNEKLRALGSQIQLGDQKNYELSESLKQAIENISRARQQPVQQQQKQEEEEEESSETGNTLPGLDFFNKPASTTTTNNTTTTTTDKKPADPVDPITKPIDKTVKKLVLQGYTQIGDYKYRTTNLFGIREGENDVEGRTGKHSGGVDVVGHDQFGVNRNLPIVVADGTIVSILKGEDGNRSTTDGKPSSGYVVKVRMNDGKIITYSHLSPKVYKNKAALLNKEVKRGELLYEPDEKWTGTGTGPHVKIGVQSFDGNNLVNDYTNPDNDPTPYILYGKK